MKESLLSYVLSCLKIFEQYFRMKHKDVYSNLRKKIGAILYHLYNSNLPKLNQNLIGIYVVHTAMMAISESNNGIEG